MNEILSTAIFIFDLILTSARSTERIVDERITFEIHEVFTFFSDFRDPITDASYQLEKPPLEEENSTASRRLQKRQLPDDQYRTWRIITESRPDYVYDYDQFKAEYDREVDKLKQDQAKLNLSEFVTTRVENLCGTDKIYAIGPFTVKCLLRARFGSSTSAETRIRASHKLRNIVYIWVVFVILLFAYGWGHAGWCSEFCPCDICYPQDEYERIKRYLALNPPGTLTTRVVRKQTDSAKTLIEKQYYKPTETERYLYDDIWNAIYRV